MRPRARRVRGPSDGEALVHRPRLLEFRRVAQCIKDQAARRNLLDKFDEVMVPTEKVVEVRRGRKVDAEREFLPGLCAREVDLTDEVYHLIKNTPKVTGFLGADKSKPVPIPDSEAERIKARWRRASTVRAVHRLRNRRAGRVADGPFASFSGVVEESTKAEPQGGGVHLRPARHRLNSNTSQVEKV